jgi:hypothetical protein
MTPSRRQFVASIATIPFLPPAVEAQRRPAASAPDPVLEQILSNLRELSAEFESTPGSRKATMRAMEATLAVGATHLAAHYDVNAKAALRRRQSRLGRAALVNDIVTRAHENKNHNVSHEVVDAAMTRLEQQGVSGCFRDIQQTIRRIRLQAPDQIQAAGVRVAQFDYCSDLHWMISLMEGVVAVACGIAILEPTVGGEIACGALTLALGLLYVQRAIFC